MLLILLSTTTNAGLLLLTMHFNERQRAAQSEAIADVAEATARVLSQKLSSLAKEAKVVAAEVADSPDDLARVEARLHAAAAASGHHYILGDQKITQIVNTTAPQDVDHATTREPGELVSIFAGRDVIITEPRRSRFVGEWRNGEFHPDRFFGIRVPVRVGGEVRYVLTLLASPARMRDVLAGTYRPQGWGATLLDQKGRRIARIPEDPSLIGKQAPAEVLDRSRTHPRGIVKLADVYGRPSTGAVTAIPESPWRVAIWANHEVLANGRLTREMWLAFANLVILAVILGTLWRAGTAPNRSGD